MEKDGETWTFALYPDKSSEVINSGQEKGFDNSKTHIREGLDTNRKATASLHKQITPEQEKKFFEYLGQSQKYGERHNNCSHFASNTFEKTTGIKLEVQHELGRENGLPYSMDSPAGLEKSIQSHTLDRATERREITPLHKSPQAEPEPPRQSFLSSLSSLFNRNTAQPPEPSPEKAPPEKAAPSGDPATKTLHPDGMKPDTNTATTTNQKTEGAHMAETSILGDIIDFASETVGEIAQGISTEVKDLANSFSNAHPDSGASPAQIQEAAYFSKAVDDPQKYPPLNEDMKSQVNDRQASEDLSNALRERNGNSVSMSTEDRQALTTEDRMQSYLSNQNTMTMR